MADAPMDVDDEVEAPSSSTSKGDKKRFEVKKVIKTEKYINNHNTNAIFSLIRKKLKLISLFCL